jgi:pimeloyl-ACP methyl ester carboxylesterase
VSLPEAFAEFSGRRLCYRDAGNGVPVVFLHAGSGSSLMWAQQVAAFASYRFIAYDRLGHGGSALLPGADAATAADDLGGLLDYLKIKACHLVGTAAGAIVALDYALSFPQRLRSLVIANTHGGVQDDDYRALQRRLRPAPHFDALPAHVRELGPAYRAAHPEGEARWIALEHQGRARQAVTQPPRNPLTFAALETLAVPTLLLTGDADLYMPAPVLKLFSDRIRNSNAVVLTDVGHSAYWERPEAFNRAVLDFIQDK